MLYETDTIPITGCWKIPRGDYQPDILKINIYVLIYMCVCAYTYIYSLKICLYILEMFIGF